MSSLTCNFQSENVIADCHCPQSIRLPIRIFASRVVELHLTIYLEATPRGHILSNREKGLFEWFIDFEIDQGRSCIESGSKTSFRKTALTGGNLQGGV